MGKITTENRRALENAKNYDDAVLNGMVNRNFASLLRKLMEEKKISSTVLGYEARLSKSYIDKLRSDEHAWPSRKAVINIALALNATLEETNELLKTAQYQELYTRDEAESVIIWGILRQRSGDEIKEILREKKLIDQIFPNEEI